MDNTFINVKEVIELKYTVITGSSSGIGYSTALAFAKRGKNLILVARRIEKLKELKDKIQTINKNVKVIIYSVDLSNTDDVQTFYKSLKEYHIETWINNAGLGDFSSVYEQNTKKIQNMIQLNIEAVTILSTLFVKEYANVEGTQLINVSSAGGYTMISDFVTYSATKFYVSAFTEGLAQELISKGFKMKVKVLAPAVTQTEFELRSLDINSFNYEEQAQKFHTSGEMSDFLLDLYDSNKIVGIVDESTYEFQLRDPLFAFREYESTQ